MDIMYRQIGEFRRGHSVDFEKNRDWSLDQITSLGLTVEVADDAMWVDAWDLPDADGCVDEYRQFKAIGHQWPTPE